MVILLLGKAERLGLREGRMDASGGENPPFVMEPLPWDYNLAGNLASLSSRVRAFLVDSVLVALVLVALEFALPSVASILDLSPSDLGGRPLGVVLAAFLLVPGIQAVYFGTLESLWGQSVGKRVIGLRVVDISSRRSPPIGRTLVRNILRVVDALPGFYLVGLISISRTENRQRLGDLAADIVVVAV